MRKGPGSERAAETGKQSEPSPQSKPAPRVEKTENIFWMITDSTLVSSKVSHKGNPGQKSLSDRITTSAEDPVEREKTDHAETTQRVGKSI
ncbi:hypothetical protein PTTG_30907, partial [Puccinia triticina 1-1 BBBD Race 1]